MDYKEMNAIGIVRLMLTDGVITEEIAGKYFPELKESEDEKIRKELIEFVKSRGGFKQEYIAWLEKQGEQKPVIEMKSAEESLGIDSDTYNKIVDECIYGEQKAIDDAPLVNSTPATVRTGMINHDGKVVKPTGWSDVDNRLLDDVILAINSMKEWGHEDRELHINFIKSVKNRVQPQPQPKQEWSDEDEKMILSIEQVMNCASLLNIVQEKVNKIRTWLKSLKDRYTWKPSDELLNNILDVLSFDNCTSKRRELLESLYKQLKKLMEE